jgi:hypothetical protein
MTRDEIDELMKENGIVVVGEAVYALVQLVIEQEREACAKVCEEDLRDEYIRQDRPARDEALLFAAISDCANAIRARGEK